jgi:hypothetical protein
MLQSQAVRPSFEGRNIHFEALRIAGTGARVVQLFDRARDQKASLRSPLDCYVEGWAEANVDKIIDATAPGYRFRDPLVGSFLRQSLDEYFDALEERLSRAGTIRRSDIACFLRGPIDRPSHLNGVQFWREAPRIGLTGVSQIEVGSRGVIGETVAYDLNSASDMLRRPQ